MRERRCEGREEEVEGEEGGGGGRRRKRKRRRRRRMEVRRRQRGRKGGLRREYTAYLARASACSMVEVRGATCESVWVMCAHSWMSGGRIAAVGAGFAPSKVGGAACSSVEESECFNSTSRPLRLK